MQVTDQIPLRSRLTTRLVGEIVEDSIHELRAVSGIAKAHGVSWPTVMRKLLVTEQIVLDVDQRLMRRHGVDEHRFRRVRFVSFAFKWLNHEEISASLGCSRRDVSAVKKVIMTADITTERFATMTAADIEQLSPPDDRKTASVVNADLHFLFVIEEMKHDRLFTLQQGWVKYLGSSSEQKKYS